MAGLLRLIHGDVTLAPESRVVRAEDYQAWVEGADFLQAAKAHAAEIEAEAKLAYESEKRRGYDYSKHGQADNPFLDFITDDIVESFCVLGEPDEHVAKIRDLEAAGVTQFNIYLDSGDEEEIIAGYGRHVIPAFR